MTGGASAVRASIPARGKEPREELLDVAAELFSNVGYGKATTRAIAQAAGLRQPSLFHYFPTKEQLFAELLDRTVEPAMALLHRLEALNEPPTCGCTCLSTAT